MSDNSSWPFRLTERLHIVVALLAALVLTFVLAVAVGKGELITVFIGLTVLVSTALVLMLGDRYWLLIPFAFTSQLPAIPIQGRFLELPEIVSVLCTAAFLVRYAVKRQPFTLFRREHAPMLLYAGWIIFTFFLNPVGLSSAASGLGGARFYAKILMALAAFLIMANQKVTEKDCKTIIILLLVGSVLESAYQISIYFLPFLGLNESLQLDADPDSFYSWHQSLGSVPILLITLGFARYKASELFSMHRLWAVIGFALCVALVAMSGKRAALASIPIFAILAALVRRERGYLMLWLAGAGMAAAIIVLGHGYFFRFPLTVQRAFSTLPAQWDAELGSMEGGIDPFRAELRRQALKKIESNPWVGKGFQMDLSLANALSAQYASRGGDVELQVASCAMGSAWHNTWLGYAADFGIPASVLVGIIYLTVLVRSGKTFRASPPNSLTQTLALYIFLCVGRDILSSHTSGHASLDAFSRWWMYGLLVALTFSNRQRQTAQPAVQVPADGRVLFPPAFGDRPALQPAGAPRPSSF